MEGLKAPPELRLTGNADQSWRVFHQRFELFEMATAPKDGRSDAQKLSLLLHAAGQEAIDVYNTFTYATAAERTYGNTVTKFESYCTPKRNETYERYMFRGRMQKKGESIEQYVVDLRLKAKSCSFGELEDSLIRDQIVYGVTDQKVRRTLLSEENLTLKRAMQLCQATETMIQQMQTWTEGVTSATCIETVTKGSRYHGKDNGSKKHSNPLKREKSNDQQQSNRNSSIIKDCTRCKGTHDRKKCPAYGKTCRSCQGKNHFAQACRKSKIHAVRQAEESDEDFIIDAVETRKEKRDWIVPIKINGILVPCKLDTGAQANLLPLGYLEKMSPKPVKRTTGGLNAYGGSKIRTFGEISVLAQVKTIAVRTEMVLVQRGERPILSRETCVDLGLVRLVYEVVEAKEKSKELNSQDFGKEIVNEFSEIFQGIGCLKTLCHIKLKVDAVPVIVPPRRIPYSLRTKLKTELERLEKQNVIRKVNEPTPWVSPLVIREKPDGTLRLCLDPKTLNENIEREHYQIPTKEEIEAELAGAVYFTKLDAASGFYQIPLDEQSQLLTTFNTPFGRYCFERLPFGIASAPEIFFKHFSQIFDSVPSTRPLHDDVLVWGKSREEHDKNLREALSKLKTAKATLNAKKCVFRAGEVTYMGEIISRHGVRPDPKKIEALLEMPTPTSKTEVQRALGVVNFVGKYIPNLSAHTVHLRSLKNKDVDDKQILPEHHKEWNHIKEVLTKQPVLQFYDPEKDTKVSTDASKDGLGAVLMQRHGEEWCPVAYASRTLTQAETRYAQIEKESLGLVFGCQRFHNYIYGKDFILETDHKPLLAMSKRVLAEVPPRLQRMFLKLMKYQYKMIFTPGKSLIIADALSRASLPLRTAEDEQTHKEVEIHINSVVQSLPVSKSMMERLVEETNKDITLQSVIQQIRSGWKMKNTHTTSYGSIKEELTEANGLVLKGSRIVVPMTLRKHMLTIIHDGHLGIEKCRRRARQSLYWPNMNVQIEEQCKKCSTCNMFQYTQRQEPYILREAPDKPWVRVATDIFHHAGKNFLVVIDAYSNYIEVEELKTMSATTVIRCLKRVFSRHGIPQEVLSDNVPFESQEFNDFATEYDFLSTKSSPTYAQSNGLAEKGVQIAKRLMKKAMESQEDFQLGLLSYRNTPLEHGKSPAELLMGRSIRTRLPTMELYCKRDKLVKRKQQEKGKELDELKPGDIVRIQNKQGVWIERARVRQKVALRSYEVELERGGIWRRNRRHLRKVNERLDKSPSKESECKQDEDSSLIYRFPNKDAEDRQIRTLSTPGLRGSIPITDTSHSPMTDSRHKDPLSTTSSDESNRRSPSDMPSTSNTKETSSDADVKTVRRSKRQRRKPERLNLYSFGYVDS